MTKWRVLSPSAQLMVDGASGARGIIRDTRADGAYRFYWSVIPSEESLPTAAGRTGGLARARSIAEAPSVPTPRTSRCTPRLPALTIRSRMLTQDASRSSLGSATGRRLINRVATTTVANSSSRQDASRGRDDIFADAVQKNLLFGMSAQRSIVRS